MLAIHPQILSAKYYRFNTDYITMVELSKVKGTAYILFSIALILAGLLFMDHSFIVKY